LFMIGMGIKGERETRKEKERKKKVVKAML
jgi:hypothetical protein